MNVARLFESLAFSAWLLSARMALAADYYVAPDGDDGNAGTEAEPFATVGRGQQAAAAGDTVWVRGGTYGFSSGTVGVSFTKSGQQNALIHYFAYPGEVPVFDLSAINPSGRVTGFDVQTDYIHIRGMEITGVPQYQGGQDSWGLRIRGSNNVIELMNVHHNEAPGIFITSGANNLILNCDSHHNYDALENGGSGDGFGCHSTGAGNVLRGCRAWENSDDGYDFINAPGACTVEHSWAWRNGWVPDTNTGAGNGAGFKAGGFGLDAGSFPSTIPVHVVRHCAAWGNRSQGFYANHHPGRLDFLNNTAYDNSRNYDLLDDVGEGTHFLRNNVAFGRGGELSNSTSDDAEYNSWNGGVSLSEADFESLSDAGADGPRQDDGALPRLPFLRLAEDSDLIDAGIDVGLPYDGEAPDLGAFETGEGASTDGNGGASGTSSNDGSASTTGGGATSGLATTGAAATTGVGVTSDGTGTSSALSGTPSSASSASGTPVTGTSTTAHTGQATTQGVTSGGGANGAGGTANADGSGSDGLSATATDGSPAAESDEQGCSCSLPGADARGSEPGRIPCGLAALAIGLACRRRRAR